MDGFRFETVKTIIAEWGGAKRLGALLSEAFDERNILIVTDRPLRSSGTLNAAIQSVSDAGFNAQIFDEVVADPPESVIFSCLEQLKRTRCQLVLGIGGGSSLDVAKIVAVLAVTDQPLSEMYGIGKVRGNRLPLVLVPTTSGTGSEVTNISILTTGETTKLGIVAPQLFADVVVLDAELTVGLPANHTAATGIDAMVHAIEAYTSRHKKNPLSDALAKEALRILAQNIVAVCADGTNRTPREQMLLGAMLAGQAFTNAPVAAVHALAYPLGGHYHIPHGLSNALMLGPVLRFNMKAAAELYSQLADVLGIAVSGNVVARAEAFVEYLETLMVQTAAPRRLRDVGVDVSDLPMLAADAMKQERLLRNNPVDLTQSDALAIYEAAY